MDNRISKLLELTEALEKAIKLSSTTPTLPSLSSPKAPVAAKAPIAAATIKQPDLAPTSKKNPLNQVQQIKQPDMKDQAIQSAKEKLTLAKNGQWSLEKGDVVDLKPKQTEKLHDKIRESLPETHDFDLHSTAGKLKVGMMAHAKWGDYKNSPSHIQEYIKDLPALGAGSAGSNKDEEYLKIGQKHDADKLENMLQGSGLMSGIEDNTHRLYTDSSTGEWMLHNKKTGMIEQMGNDKHNPFNAQHPDPKIAKFYDDVYGDSDRDQEDDGEAGSPPDPSNKRKSLELVKSSRAYQIKHHSSYNHDDGTMHQFEVHHKGERVADGYYHEPDSGHAEPTVVRPTEDEHDRHANHVSIAAVDRAGKAYIHGSASVPHDSSSDVH